MMPTFDYYSGTSYPLLYLRHYQDKMIVYAHDDLFFAHDDLLFYRTFSSSLKGVTYHWFYSFPKNLLRSFHDVTDTFYNQFASLKEFQRNNNHLITLKMKSGESLKNYVNYFQSQMTLVYNCNEEVALPLH